MAESSARGRQVQRRPLRELVATSETLNGRYPRAAMPRLVASAVYTLVPGWSGTWSHARSPGACVFSDEMHEVHYVGEALS
jgi:hypothetical protein